MIINFRFKFLLFSFLLLTQISLNAQSKKEKLEETFNAYLKTVIEKDNSATVEYLYPKLFDKIPKKVLLQALEAASQDTTVESSFANDSIIGMSKMLKVEGVRYLLLDYSFDLKMKFLASEDELDDVDEMNEAILAGFNLQFGSKNVSLDKETNEFTVLVSSQMYCILDPEYEDWKFLEKKSNLMGILKEILPAKVIEKL